MYKKVFVAAFCLTLLIFINNEAMAQRGRGGGGLGGGGMSGHAATPSMNRSPSMSRPAPALNRPAPNMARPATSMSQPAPNMSRPAPAINRPAPSLNRPAPRPSTGMGSGAAERPGGGGASQMGTRSPQAFQQPSQSDLGNFLNIPNTPTGSSRMSQTSQLRAGQPRPGPSTRSDSTSGQPSSNSGSKTFETARGGTVTIGGKAGSGVTEGGATVGGAVGGIKIETAGGETYGRVSGAGGATDGTNSAVRGGSITGAQDGQGNSAVNVRGGYADSSGYRQGGSVTASQNKYGYTSVSGRAGYGYGNGTGHIGSVAAVRGPAGNVVSAGHGETFVNGQFVGGQSWSAVNGNYVRWNAFGPAYVGNYPNAWWPGKWAVATTAWANATYAMAGSYCGCDSSVGMYYDYGENVTYDDGIVYQDGEAVASAEEYYQQAEQIAQEGSETDNEDWMPLGVFSLIVEGQTQTDKIVQLALNKEGVIRGNYQDLVADSMLPITGAVDKTTQRVALKLTGNDILVVETGLFNLTNDEVPILIHFDAERQEPRKLIRLQHPDEAGAN